MNSVEKKRIMLCAISNISSGNCAQDCSFCTQSAHHNSNIDEFKAKSIDTIVLEAKAAKKQGALGFCLVTSGYGLNEKKLDFVTRATKAVKDSVDDLMLIACNGVATKKQLKALKKAGVDSYNHNLETSREFYPKVCSTHTWDERYETCENVKKVGLMLCTGGIFGLGESREDRESFLESVQSLEPFSTPINFFHPDPALPLSNKILEEKEALKIIQDARGMLPDTRLMIAGGREIVFKTRQKEMYRAGIDAVVIGDYLTTKGEKPSRDVALIRELGFEIETSCHG